MVDGLRIEEKTWWTLAEDIVSSAPKNEDCYDVLDDT